MSTYSDSYRSLGQEYDPQQPNQFQEALLMKAWGEFWGDVMEETCPPPDSALVLITIRHALQCARALRHGKDADRQALEAALAEAIQVQTQAVLRWCDDRGAALTQPLLQDSNAPLIQSMPLPLGAALPEG